MPTVLIAGANRGIGLEFARQYAAADWRVIGTARLPADATELKEVVSVVHPLDIADATSIAALAGVIDEPLDLLICNAGVFGPRQFSDDPQGFVTTLATNAVGPTLLAHALKPCVLAGGQKRMVAITSQMGSIGDNTSGGSVAYRASKAALNAAWASLAIDWKPEGLTLALLHPGWVRTDMGGADAAISPEESVTAMRATIDGLTPDRTGAFLNRDGTPLPW